MTVTYRWGVQRAERAPTFTDPDTHAVYQDVIQVLHWSCTATDGVNTVSVYDSTPIAWDRPVEPFTPFANVTKAQVAGWVQANMTGRRTVAQLKADLANQLAAMAAPASITTNTPAWS